MSALRVSGVPGRDRLPTTPKSSLGELFELAMLEEPKMEEICNWVRSFEGSTEEDDVQFALASSEAGLDPAELRKVEMAARRIHAACGHGPFAQVARSLAARGADRRIVEHVKAMRWPARDASNMVLHDQSHRRTRYPRNGRSFRATWPNRRARIRRTSSSWRCTWTKAPSLGSGTFSSKRSPGGMPLRMS